MTRHSVQGAAEELELKEAMRDKVGNMGKPRCDGEFHVSP